MIDTYIALRLARHIETYPNYAWDWRRLSTHPNLTPEVIDYFIDKPWDWNEVSHRVPLWIVLKHPEKPWNWVNLTLNDHIPVKDIVHHPNLPWHISSIGFEHVDQDIVPFLRTFRNELSYEDWVDHTAHADWKTIRTNMDLPWKPEVIRFRSGDITSDDDIHALERLDQDLLDWELLSEIADYSIIQRTPQFPWVMQAVSRNRSIPWPTPNVELDLHDVPIEPLQSIIRKWNAARVIQRHWFMCTINPEYRLCRKLVRKFITQFTAEIVSRNAL